MKYALLMLWFDRRRYLAGVLAVAFSAVLIGLQVGVFWGLISVVSIPIEFSSAQIWVGHPNIQAADLSRPIPRYWVDRLWSQPQVVATEEYIQGFSFWKTPTGLNEMVIVLGCNVNDKSLGPASRLPAQVRAALTEPGAVLLDRVDRNRVEVAVVGEYGEVAGRRVHVVGFVDGMGSLTGPYVLCSLPTARQLLNLRDDQTSYLLATVKQPDQVQEVVQAIRRFEKLSAFEATDFALKSKLHWVSKTKAGIAVLFVAALGLVVGAVITSQTLYAATIAAVPQLAVLRALGIPRWRLRMLILYQSFWIGLVGLIIAAPTAAALAELARRLGTNCDLPDWLWLSTGIVVLAMAVFSGLVALRSLAQAEPALLLR